MEVYIDDLQVKLRVFGNHLDDVPEIFEILRKYKMKLNLLKCSFGVYFGKFLSFIVNARDI